ncbi:hypothetical protein BGZ94_008714 [Podila epigama]|nr:hypothetical protein BGZ94_008714 [Podila epigama]
MEDHLSSSEAFAKALKGYQTSATEKINLAREAWQRNDVILPHKQEFVLEWLCSALVKAATPSKSPKDTSSNVILDLEYWQLLTDIFCGITTSRRRHRKYGLIQSRHQVTVTGMGDNHGLGVLLRVPVIPMFTAVIQNLVPQPLSTAESKSAGPKSGKKGKQGASISDNTPSTVANVQADLPSIEVLKTASHCFEMLSGPLMEEWFQPTLEQYTPLVQITLEALVEMSLATSNITPQMKEVVISFAHTVLDRFKRLVIIQPNQKKVFGLLSGKMLEAIVRARVSNSSFSGKSLELCREDIGGILRTGLFHQEHLHEYTAGYVAGKNEKSIQSYQKQLFDQLASMIKSDYASAALDIMPVFLKYFVEESRKKQRTLASSGFDRGMDSARESEFSFFKILYVLAQTQLPQIGTEEVSDASLDKLVLIMDGLNGLLSTVLDLNMYQPSNNMEADQYVFMSTSYDTINNCLVAAQELSIGRLQSTSLAGIMVLSQLDDRLLKPHLDKLWPILLMPSSEASEASLQLAKTLLEIYGKSSDLKIFLTSLLGALREFAIYPEQLAQSPLLSRGFLDAIPSNIRNYLPLPQAPSILDIFVTELMTLDSGMEIEGVESINEEVSHKKKRKLNSGKSKDEDMEKESTIESSELVIAIFIQFLKGLRITTNQEKQLNQAFNTLYDHFLKHTFENLDNSTSYQSRRLTPALRLHYSLCKASTQYWKNGMSMRFVTKNLMKTFKSKSNWSDATILSMNRVVLQHAHLTLCTAEIFDRKLAENCQELVRFTMKTSRLKRLLDDQSRLTAPWDGQLEHATGSAFLVASWQIQVNDWLDIVCRFGTTEHMELIAEVIAVQFNILVDKSTAGSITIHKLNQILLRSANFYEVPNFRPIFAQRILHGLANAISSLGESDLESQLASTIASFTETDPSTKGSSALVTPKATIADALQILNKVIQQLPKTATTGSSKKKSSKVSMTQSADTEKQGSKLLSLLSIMHLLPLEYFEKFERNVILITMVALDYHIQRYLTADRTGCSCLLLERRISNAIMIWRSDAGVLSHDPALLSMILNYFRWNCSTKYGTQDQDAIGIEILNTTTSMIECCSRFYLAQSSDPKQSESALTHIDVLLETALSWAPEALETSSRTPNGGISEARIKVVLISRICQSLVQFLELHRHHRKSQKHKLKEQGNSMDDKKIEAMWKTVSKLFATVQVKTNERVRKVIAGSGSLRLTDSQIADTQKCMDHFELLKTLVQYQQLQGASGKDKDSSWTIVPHLFGLAKSLVSTIDCNGSQEVAHLAAVLTGYSCEYLPSSEAWKTSVDGAEAYLRELLVVLARVSAEDMGEKDLAMLKSSYVSLMGQLTDEQFEVLLEWLMKEEHDVGSEPIDELALVRYLDITFLGVHQSHKRKVRRQISKLLTRLIQILQISQSVSVVVRILDIMAGLCSETSFGLRSWEIGLVLEGITSLMSPATPLLSPSSKDLGLDEKSTVRGLSNQETAKIFTALYHVLINIARFRQEELTTLIPVFTTILQGIFHGFKSLHGSIAKKQQGVESLIKSPFMLLSAGAIHPESQVTSAHGTSTAIVGDPLPVECAENFARLLTALGSKGVSHSSSHHNSNSESVGGSHSFAITTDASKAFGKHAPYILMEYFTIQSSVAASVSQQGLRNALLPGLYALLNLCSDWEREMMLVGLDNTGKMLLKGLYADYLKYHKYTGR